MNERIRKGFVYMSLVLAVAWAINNVDSKKPAAPEQPAATAGSTTTSTIPDTTGAAVDWRELETAAWGNNPFSTSARATAPTISWHLKGILYSAESPLAYINSRRVRVGDTVDNAEVVNIERHRVTLRHNGKVFHLPLDEG
jgi:type II secretory pathway component PulC